MNLDRVICNKLHGSVTPFLYKMFSCLWRTPSYEDFIKTSCYKIVAIDPRDDTVDMFSNLVVGVVDRLAKNDYSSATWKQFYESLTTVF